MAGASTGTASSASAPTSSKALEWLFALKFAINCLLFLLKSRVPRIITLLDLFVCVSSVGDFVNHYHNDLLSLYIYLVIFIARFLVINIAFQYRRKTSMVPDIVVSVVVVASIVYSLWLYITTGNMPGRTLTIVALCLLEGFFFLKHSDRIRQRKLCRFNANFRLTARFPFASRRRRPRHHHHHQNVDLEAPLIGPDQPKEITVTSSVDSEGDLEHGSKVSSASLDSPRRVFATGPDAHYLCTATGTDYSDMEWPYSDTAGGILCYYQNVRSTTPVVNLLLIHQFGGGCFTWKRSVPLLVNECNANVTCFDRPAHGFTERPKDPASPVYIMSEGGRPVLLPPYSISFARETIDLFRRFSAGTLPQILVGVGAGALLALESAACNESVSGVVLISPTVTTGMGLPGVIRSILTSNVSRALSLSMLRSEVADFMMRKSWYRSSKIPQWLQEDYRVPTRLEGWDAAIVEMNKQRTNVRWKVPVDLPKCPILLLTGDHDKVVPKREYQRFFTHLLSKKCDARWEVVPRCGHLVIMGRDLSTIEAMLSGNSHKRSNFQFTPSNIQNSCNLVTFM